LAIDKYVMLIQMDDRVFVLEQAGIFNCTSILNSGTDIILLEKDICAIFVGYFLWIKHGLHD